MNTEDAVRSRFLALQPHMSELDVRLFAAAEARAIGRGGVVMVSRVTGLARSTINRGLKNLQDPSPPTGRIRRKSAGRPTLKDSCPNLLEDLRSLVEPATMGDPMRLLLWVSKSHEKLAATILTETLNSSTLISKLVSSNLRANLLFLLIPRRKSLSAISKTTGATIG